jgi:hypothetical protein
MATVLASNDNDTDLPDQSPDASPSISFPTFCQQNEQGVVGEGVVGEGVVGEGVVGEGVVGEGVVGEGVVSEGVEGAEGVGGTLLFDVGLVLIARRNTKNSPVVTIDVERISTRRNTQGFRDCLIVLEHVSIALLLLKVRCLMQSWCVVLLK